jgi:Zn-dependent protease with chaperone function
VTTACPACGRPLDAGDRFCGSCGARAPVVAEPPAPPISAAAPPISPPAWSRAIGLTLLVAGLGVGLGSLGLRLWLTTPRPAASTVPTAVVVPAAPVPQEVDHPGDFAYVATPPTCAAETRLTDALKGTLGPEIDARLRDGVHTSWAEEQKLGDGELRSFTKRLGGRLESTGALPDYFRAVAAPLVARVQRHEVTYTFYVWEGTKVVNAITLPGGHIIVSRPLFDQWLHNEAQLAAVLGHEIGHADLGHPLAVIESLRGLGVPADDVDGQALAALARLPYSTVQEETADRYGAGAMHAVGYSVFQAVALWDDRAAEQPRAPKARPADPFRILDMAVGELENLTVTHPDPARRACLLRRAAHDLYASDPRETAYVGKTNLGRRVPMSEAQF